MTRWMILGTVLFTAAIAFAPSAADAGCRCACVNGEVRALCSSTIDLEPICPPRICPLVPPAIEPLPSLRLPPLGTSECRMAQVLNPWSRRYEWKEVCH
jgi:hypothetical protein